MMGSENRCTHSYRGQELEALANRPDLSEPSRKAALATGTEDARADRKNAAIYLAQNERRGRIEGGASGRAGRASNIGPARQEPGEQAKNVAVAGLTERAGFEPARQVEPV